MGKKQPAVEAEPTEADDKAKRAETGAAAVREASKRPHRPLDVWRCMALYAAMAGLVGFMGVQLWAAFACALAAAFLYFVPPVGGAPAADDGTP